MKLKKMMLHDEHEVMNASEMKQIVGGQVIGSSTYGMNNGKCSGGCPIQYVEGNWVQGKCTRYKITSPIRWRICLCLHLNNK